MKLCIILFISVILVIIYSLAENYNSLITIDYINYQIELSIYVATALVFFLMLLSSFLVYIWLKSTSSLNSFTKIYHNYFAKRKIFKFESSLAALMIEDTKLAKKLLPSSDDNLSNLLKLQIAELDGNYDHVVELSAKLSHNKIVKIAAARSLINASLAQNDYSQALKIAEQLLRLKPKTKWLLEKLLFIYEQQFMFEHALIILKKMASLKYYNLSANSTKVAELYYNIAKINIEQNDIKQALKNLEYSIEYFPTMHAMTCYFPLACRLLSSKQVVVILEKAWVMLAEVEIIKYHANLINDVNQSLKILELIKPSSTKHLFALSKYCLKLNPNLSKDYLNRIINLQG